MNPLKFFKRAAPVTFEENKVDTSALDRSFNLLQESTAAVSSAAIEAARALQERLDDSEHRFYWTIDSIEDFVLIKDGEGRWQILNKFGQKLFNFHHGEFFNKTDAEIALEYPHLKQTLDYCQITDAKAWSTGTAVRSEEKIPYPTGLHYLDVIKTPTYEDDGSRKELIIVGRDVSEVHSKTKREKACFQALNSASDAIAIIDEKAHVFFCNDQFVYLFDLGQYQQVVDRHVLDVLPSIPKFEEMWAEVQSNNTWSTKCPKTDIQLTVIPMMNGQPKPIYYICTFKQTHKNILNVCDQVCASETPCSLNYEDDK